MAEKVLKSNVVGSFGFVSLDIKNVILKPPLAILPTVKRNDEVRRNDRKSPIDRPDHRKRHLHEPMRIPN